ncbi:glycosyltransferase family 2 protein [Cytophagaceae bacterium YF14B1]|uniref:Glycosyltransferase family 2 protein n=1 Tax=Xanthocytophaga flava TaxID=3048013 RepID=A0AAE3QUL8_9BACT|nr:glycosyltransferase family 2 protein [Xanthocytophaga flavus]MDJ1483673.1 glycosyltransferase family 2 protein [Xanthocytophaga flavus]
MEQPLVTVICLCYNQECFVGDTLLSVYQQTYSAIELIIIDNGSTDDSVSKIETFLEICPHAIFIRLNTNQNTAIAFNQALSHSSGKYIIHISGNHILVPHRVERQLNAFSKLDKRYGIVYSDAELLNEQLDHIGFWYERNSENKQFNEGNSGNVYASLFRKKYICSASMMVARVVYKTLNGYDESLEHEEFDFQVRSAKKYYYYYQNEALTKIRICGDILNDRNYIHAHLLSILKGCQHAYRLNSFDKENQALAICIRRYLLQALFTDNRELVHKFGQLLSKITELTRLDHLWLGLAKSRLPLFIFYRQYLRLKKPVIVF